MLHFAFADFEEVKNFENIFSFFACLSLFLPVRILRIYPSDIGKIKLFELITPLAFQRKNYNFL